MSHIYRILIFVIAVPGMLYACNSKELVIKPLYPYRHVSFVLDRRGSPTGEQAVFKHFFLEGWDRTDSAKVRELTAFARSQCDSDYAKYRQFEIHFYNKTAWLNETLDSATDDVDNIFPQDKAASFKWRNGILFMHTYEDGKCLDCSEEMKE